MQSDHPSPPTPLPRTLGRGVHPGPALIVARLSGLCRRPGWLNLFLMEILMRLKLLVVLALVLSFSSAARSGDAKDGDTIQGTWLPSTAELGGKMFPEEVRKTIKLVVKDD